MPYQIADDLGQISNAHEKDQSADASSDLVPSDQRFLFVGILMPGDECDRGTEVTVRDWYSGVSWCRIARRDARHDFKWNAFACQCFCFFTTASKNEWVAALQAG